MCAECGCAANPRDPERAMAEPTLDGHEHEHGHEHGHEYEHEHQHEHEQRETVALRLEKQILARNDEQAAFNRHWLSASHIVALNLLSSPGAGKTTLLERTLRDAGAHAPVAVLEGDQEGELDALRIREAGGRVVQLHTGQGCHLDARLVQRGLHELAPAQHSLVLIENVGNLVCPALFDIGEHAKVVVASVAEGDDKPLKYPYAFRAADLVLLNKIDLLPYVSFDPSRFRDCVRRVKPGLRVLLISATRGDGLESWYDWLRERTDHDRT